MTKNYRRALVLLLFLSLGLTTTVNLNPGDSSLLMCPNTIQVTQAANSVNVVCPPNTSTPTPTPAPLTATPTAAPPTSTPLPTPTASGCCAAFWHAPDGNHEHGDAPPAWLTAAGYTPGFTWPGNTPSENQISFKHSAFKGFAGTPGGIDIYLLIHLDINPGGHASRFHSFQFWMRDAAGGVSNISGWLDFGPDNTTQTGPNIARSGCDDTSLRPVMIVNAQGCGPVVFETWYPRAAGHLGLATFFPDFGISSGATYYDFGSPTDPSTWVPTGNLNLTRRLEVNWYANRDSHRGAFWSTQFGRIVSGPNDPVCGTPYTVGARTYTLVCLAQFVAPTASTIQFPGNSFQKSYPGPVSLPN